MTGSYSSLADVRRLAGGIGSISDPDMQGFLLAGNVLAEACTGLKDLSNSDVRYPLMEQLSEYYASAIVRDHYSDKMKAANTHWDRAKSLCEQIVQFGLEGSGAATSVSQGYATYPLNKEGLYFGSEYVRIGSNSSSPFAEDEIA